MLILVIIAPLALFSQESTIDNDHGLWLDDAIWSDGTEPRITSIALEFHIYGNVVRGMDLDFTQGNLYFPSPSPFVLMNQFYQHCS